MNLAKLGMGLGFGMMALGVIERFTHKGAPEEDPMNAYLGHVSGSLIVFGAALGAASMALSNKDKLRAR